MPHRRTRSGSSSGSEAGTNVHREGVTELAACQLEPRVARLRLAQALEEVEQAGRLVARERGNCLGRLLLDRALDDPASSCVMSYRLPPPLRGGMLSTLWTLSVPAGLSFLDMGLPFLGRGGIAP